MSIECLYGPDAARAHVTPLPEIPPDRRVSLAQLRDRLGISRSALESRIRRGKYRRPTLIAGRGFFDAVEVACWVQADRKRRG
jgi:hypothetical protein